jgi:hypothetical protein
MGYLDPIHALLCIHDARTDGRVVEQRQTHDRSNHPIFFFFFTYVSLAC